MSWPLTPKSHSLISPRELTRILEGLTSMWPRVQGKNNKLHNTLDSYSHSTPAIKNPNDKMLVDIRKGWRLNMCESKSNCENGRWEYVQTLTRKCLLWLQRYQIYFVWKLRDWGSLLCAVWPPHQHARNGWEISPLKEREKDEGRGQQGQVLYNQTRGGQVPRAARELPWCTSDHVALTDSRWPSWVLSIENTAMIYCWCAAENTETLLRCDFVILLECKDCVVKMLQSSMTENSWYSQIMACLVGSVLKLQCWCSA